MGGEGIWWGCPPEEGMDGAMVTMIVGYNGVDTENVRINTEKILDNTLTFDLTPGFTEPFDEIKQS